MRVLLVNPLCDLRLTCGGYQRFHTPIPPYGLASMAASLLQAGHEVRIADHFAERQTFDAQVNSLLQWRPELIGISLLTTALGSVRQLLRAMRERADYAPKIVLGNTHATLFHRELVGEGLADYAIRGEGERPLVELADRLERGGALDGVAGLTFAGPHGPVANPDRTDHPDLDDLPFPAWDLLDLKRYGSTPLLGFDDIALPILATRGCPFNCIFCAQRSSGIKFRAASPGRVADYILENYERRGITTFGFIDAYFPPRPDYARQFAEALRERGLKGRIRFATELRVDQAEEEVLAPLVDVGLTTVMLGFESGNQQVLDSMHKRQTLEQSERAMDICRRFRLHTVGFFIIGLPGENERTIDQTVDFAIKLDCDIAKFNLAIPFPGTELHGLVSAQGQTESSRYERFSSWYDDPDDEGLVFVPQGMSARRLKFLQHRAMWRFYVRPRKIVRHLRLGIISLPNMLAGFWVLLRSLAATLARGLQR